VSIAVVAPAGTVTLGAVIPVGGELKPTVTAPVNGADRVTVTVVVADFPRSISRSVGFALRLKPPVGGGSGATVNVLVAE
jgi:hypothetical protein